MKGSDTLITGIIYGKFDVLHAGHIRLFHFAKSRCDKLIVAVIDNNKSNKLRKIDLRIEDLSAINLIDKILTYTDLQDLLKAQKPDVVFKGNEFSRKHNAEKSIIDLIDAKLFFMSSDERYDVRLKGNDLKNKNKIYLQNYREKYNLDDSRVTESINLFKNLSGIVTGDLIYDQYINCIPRGMSQEDKNIVYEKDGFKEFVGGAGIVAAHCNGLGSKAELVSCIGNDQMGQKSSKSLESLGVKSKLWLDDTRNTIIKTRYIWDDRPIFRVSVLDTLRLPDNIQEQYLQYIDYKLQEIDYLIVSDFNYGLLSPDICNHIMQSAKKNNVAVSVDCQISSQTGDLQKYRGAKLVTPTEVEARSALKDFDSGVAYLGEKLRDELEADHLILKLGAQGALIFTELNGIVQIENLPALNVNRVVDTSGAGDSILAVATLSLCVSNDIFLAAYLGSIAAGLQVTQRGNTPLNEDFW